MNKTKNDSKIIDSLNNQLGVTISNIHYTESSFHYPISGNWSSVKTDDFLFQAQEWLMTLSNDNYLSFTSEIFREGSTKVFLNVESYKEQNVSNKLTIPNEGIWSKIIGKKIIGFKLYKKAKKRIFFGLNFGFYPIDDIYIILFHVKNASFIITCMNGDVGRYNFYPHGFLENEVGLILNKEIIEHYSVFNGSSDLVLVYDSTSR